MAELTEMPSGIWTWVAPSNDALDVCEVVCYTEVRPGLSGNKIRWHFSEQR